MESRKLIRDLTVLRNIPLNQRHFILELQITDEFPAMLPGQFVQVLVDNSPSTFLRRPFSIHSTDPGTNTFRLLIQIKGKGTRHLRETAEGKKLNVVFPLGNSFSLPQDPEVLLVGGGCGVAPLLFLAQYLRQNNIYPTILTGWKTEKDIFEPTEYEKYGDLLIITEDGTCGEKGLVTEHSVFQKEKTGFRKIYCCGPEPMMRSVAAIAKIQGTECEVSLENTMACGFGVCLCCVTPTVSGNQRVCVEGPVFNSKELGW
jgi:dihydroorotate dehydrogenase electron transfer subunit